MSRQCSHIQCGIDARWQVGLRVKTASAEQPFFEVRYSVFVCDLHQVDVLVEDLAAAQAWDMISEVFRRSYGAEPDLASSKLIFWDRPDWLDPDRGAVPIFAEECLPDA